MENKYRVGKYFDAHFEGWVSNEMSEDDAKKKASEMNSKLKTNLTEYIARKI